jgi:hypothetical protein
VGLYELVAAVVLLVLCCSCSSRHAWPPCQPDSSGCPDSDSSSSIAGWQTAATTVNSFG